MSTPKTLLADSLARSLSSNAAQHLRAARIARVPDRSISAEGLRATLLHGGFPAPEPLLHLETAAGGAAFPHGLWLGASCFLAASPSLRPKDLPRLGGDIVFPIFGNPDLLEEWESPFAMMGPSGAISLYDAPHGPAPAYDSLAHFLEIEALAPFSEALHVLRVDALCGDMLAGLVGAAPHAPAPGAHAAGFVGEGVWVKELRIGLEGPEGWGRSHGTFLLTENVDTIIDAMTLLLGEGHSFGHIGPTGTPPPGSKPIVTIYDEHPELGYRARVEVTAWGEPGARVITHREMRGA